MNVLQILYCRGVQLVFRLAQPFLPYRSPKLLHQVHQIPRVLLEKKIHRVLLVTDFYLRSSGATQALEQSLTEQGITVAVYDQTRPNPTVENVEAALSLYHKNNCKALIAMGGGSSMDCAKAVGARVVYPRKSLSKLKGILKVRRRLPPLIAIPTTAGTGSETTVTAVITDTKSHHKYTMNNFTMIPHYAVLDPAVTLSLPPHLTATTGMDALTHAVEAYIGLSTTAQTRKLALSATRLVFDNIETAVQEPQNIEARKQMLLAAHRAGLAFSKSYVGYIHAVAHSLGGQYNIPHGLANAVLLPIGLEQYGSCIHKKLKALAIAANIAKETDPPEKAAEAFIRAIRELNHRLEMDDTLEGILPQDIPTMAKYASAEANPLYPVPRLMDAWELERLYYLVMKRRTPHDHPIHSR